MANWWPRLGALLVILVSACLLPVSSAAQTPTTPPTRAVSAAPAALLMVMDLSGSMNDNDANGKNKLTGAKQSLSRIVGDTASSSTPLGLWTYPTAGSNCDPGSFLAGADGGVRKDTDTLMAQVSGLKADGGTPTGPALRASVDSLKANGITTATVVLISDGESNCGQAPCDTAKQIVAEGFDVTVEALGFQLSGRHCHVVERGKLGECGVSTSLSYKGHRYPVEIINHCVWLYFRFPLSFREVEEMMLERGVVVSYETIRRWCAKFGQAYANQLRRRRARPGDKWYLDEVFIKINGTLHYLWRAVDQDGNVLDVLVQARRNAVAAKRFFRKLLKRLEYVPRVIVTDKLASYQVAHREMLASVEHRRSKYLNNRAENSHQPTRQRERAMKRFTSTGHAQRFLSAFSGISPHFRPNRHRLSAPEWRTEMADRFTVWQEVTATDAAA